MVVAGCWLAPWFPQLDVLVTDGGGKTDRQSITVNVNRNLFTPVVTAPREYNISIDETYELARTIVTVAGSDADQVHLPFFADFETSK